MTSLFVKNEKMKQKIALVKYVLSFLISILTKNGLLAIFYGV